MFKWLLNLFKKTQVYINITDEVFDNKKIYCFEEFYEALGLTPYIQKMQEANNNIQYDVRNIQCNSQTHYIICQFLKYNLLKTKNKYKRMYSDKALNSSLAFDSLAYSPKINENVTTNQIRVILPGNKEYKKVN